MSLSPTPSRNGSDIEWTPPTPQDPNITIYVSKILPGEPGSGWPPKVQIMVNPSRSDAPHLSQSFWLSDEGLRTFASAIAEAVKWRGELVLPPQGLLDSPEAQAVIDQIKESIP